MDSEKIIKIPFGAKDSELCGWEYTIPGGMEAIIKDGKVIVRPKESEDERIRGAILIYLDWLDGRKDCQPKGDYTIRDMIAYLEKQKNYELTEDDKKFIPQELIFLCNDLISHRKPLSVDEKGARKIKAFLKSLHRQPHKTKEEWEKQKEQKPAYTAKERWKEMRLEVYAQASGNRHEPNYSDDSTKMFSLCDIDEIFEKIGDSTIGSQPAEWSEEDENIYNKALDAIYYKDLNDKDEVVDSLKSLCDLISRKRKVIPPYARWKPSEEQMAVLKNAIHFYGKTIGEEILESLYNDLQKLL